MSGSGIFTFVSIISVLFALLKSIRWTRSGLDPRDFRRPSLPPPAGFGTAAEKSFSSSDTSNSGAI